MPDAVNSTLLPFAVTASVTVVVSYFASAIWLAIVRFQIRSYSRCSSRSSSPETSDGLRNVSPDGRIASWASCAFLLLFAYTRGFSGTAFSPYISTACARAAVTACVLSAVESVRI